MIVRFYFFNLFKVQDIICYFKFVLNCQDYYFIFIFLEYYHHNYHYNLQHNYFNFRIDYYSLTFQHLLEEKKISINHFKKKLTISPN